MKWDDGRRAGYALPGQAVRVELPPYSKHLNLLMAADVNVGAIAPFVFPGTMDSNVFYCWLKKLLLPQIRGKKRVCLMDNHRAHLDVSIRELVEQEGHKLVRRPVASPDMAWIETCFSQIKENLRKYCSDVNLHNLKECIYAEAELISFAVHCHYLVPGFPYHPYSGCAPLVDME
ncbi:hypothetical protein Pelo_9593 [Pelomyxa schiedti]|nr:hypothetical protein Pelo_9593 [Pelomyxa schiedti]